MKKLLVIITIIGLIGTVTNLVYISPIPSLFAAIFFPLILTHKNHFPLPVFWLFVFFLFVLISTSLYHPGSFSNFKFYRYDGNFIISYLPLLVLPFFSFNFNIGKLFRNFLYITSFISILAFIAKGLKFQDGFSGLFIANNAAGGFYSIVTSLAFIYFLERKTYTNLFLLALNAFFLYATYSRGSILGLGVGLMCLFLLKKHKSYLISFLIIGISAIQIYILVGTYPEYKRHIMNSPTADIYRNLDDYVYERFGNVSTKYKNVLIRSYETWPRAVDCFFHSPLLGTGFGSVNDVPFIFDNTIPFIYSSNQQQVKDFNDSHAHHSFLHFLGELGLLGLGVFLCFWRSVYKFLLKNNQEPKIRDFLLVSFFNLTIMSFTEHRITTPSNALPFVLSFCLYYLFVNYQKKAALTTNGVL
ncbi:O-antigen ligase family protein [Adhaeribacter aquaticus]|uniref:O-antigen ligase family protein n=1 Tax=Adhaeribacter aquaticus TaxID=299567 RepID=UPI0003FD3031|nr:O-antigen ligase family protein [Adhaeribacter aquaticus]